jgi:hypothetical protein
MRLVTDSILSLVCSGDAATAMYPRLNVPRGDFADCGCTRGRGAIAKVLWCSESGDARVVDNVAVLVHCRARCCACLCRQAKRALVTGGLLTDSLIPENRKRSHLCSLPECMSSCEAVLSWAAASLFAVSSCEVVLFTMSWSVSSSSLLFSISSRVASVTGEVRRAGRRPRRQGREGS